MKSKANSAFSNQKIRVLGAMTGTSCDGIDASCMEFRGTEFKLVWKASTSIPRNLRKRVLAAQLPGNLRATELLSLHRDLGIWYGRSLKKMIRQHPQKPPMLISNHGQTIAHDPRTITCQIGDPAIIAYETGVTTVARLRSGDVAAGGEGAPLVPKFHQLIAKEIFQNPRGVAVHNLGGISNLTYFPQSGDPIAFDTGPGNLWIDEAVSQVTRGRKIFDRDGKMASRGEPDLKAVQKILKHPYFKQAPPRSTGRSDWPFSILKKSTRARGEDLVATATMLTALSISQSYKKWIQEKRRTLKNILVCGGGARNRTLIKTLDQLLPGVEVCSIESKGLDPQAVESMSFAYLGYLSLMGVPMGGTWTGIKAWAPPGQIVPGQNWTKLVKYLHENPCRALGKM